MLVLGNICLKLRALLAVLVIAAMAVVQIPGATAASSGLAAMNDMGPCQHMTASPGDLQTADGSVAGCPLHGEGGLGPGPGSDCEAICAVTCVSPASALITGTSAPATCVSDHNFDKIASVSGSSALTWSAAPPPRL